MEGPTKQNGGTSHLNQNYCELEYEYITLTRITEYIVARVVTIQIFHFTGDKVKTPAFKMSVSPLRYVSLYDSLKYSLKCTPCTGNETLYKPYDP